MERPMILKYKDGSKFVIIENAEEIRYTQEGETTVIEFKVGDETRVVKIERAEENSYIMNKDGKTIEIIPSYYRATNRMEPKTRFNGSWGD